jgi:hypothetical protein
VDLPKNGAKLKTETKQKQTEEGIKTEKTCPICKASFSPKKHSRQKFCSKKCTRKDFYRRHKKASKPTMCPNCRKEFTPRIRDTIFCSSKCYHTFWARERRAKQPKKEYIKTCKQCGKTFISKRIHAKICSNKCWNKYYRETHVNEVKINQKEYYYLNREERLAAAKKWRETNPNRHKENYKRWAKNNKKHLTNYNRTRKLGQLIDGKKVVFMVVKRVYPNDKKCELCGNAGHLSYHHWGEIVLNEPLTGIWACNECHPIIENPENAFHILSKFALKKEQIDQEIISLKSNRNKQETVNH